MLLYFVKSKNDTKCKIFAVFRSIFILLYFLRFQEGATAPLATPLNPPLIIVEVSFNNMMDIYA